MVFCLRHTRGDVTDAEEAKRIIIKDPELRAIAEEYKLLTDEHKILIEREKKLRELFSARLAMIETDGKTKRFDMAKKVFLNDVMDALGMDSGTRQIK